LPQIELQQQWRADLGGYMEEEEQAPQRLRQLKLIKDTEDGRTVDSGRQTDEGYAKHNDRKRQGSERGRVKRRGYIDGKVSGGQSIGWGGGPEPKGRENWNRCGEGKTGGARDAGGR